MVKHIVIVGAGNLGSRHLQALSNINLKVDISLIDPNENALKTAKKLFSKTLANEKIISINFYKTLSPINRNVDIAVIATTADVRRDVIESFIKKVYVKNIILEKVLFQKIEDFEPIENLFKNENVNAWVNCPRRMWPFYKQQANDLQESNVQEVHVSGASWGLGSNLIHFIDLISFITKKQRYDLKTDLLSKTITQSKRKGFLELTGTISGYFEKGPFFTISSHLQGKNSLTIKIVSESSVINIDEGDLYKTQKMGRSWISSINNNWEWEVSSFDIPLQSQLTHLAVQQILQKNESDLTLYSESAQLHMPMINGLIEHIKRSNNSSEAICAIT